MTLRVPPIPVSRLLVTTEVTDLSPVLTCRRSLSTLATHVRLMITVVVVRLMSVTRVGSILAVPREMLLSRWFPGLWMRVSIVLELPPEVIRLPRSQFLGILIPQSRPFLMWFTMPEVRLRMVLVSLLMLTWPLPSTLVPVTIPTSLRLLTVIVLMSTGASLPLSTSPVFTLSYWNVLGCFTRRTSLWFEGFR